MNRRARLLVFVLMLATIGCDRVTKNLARTSLIDSPRLSYLGDTVRLEYAENTGAFLSLGASLPESARHGILVIGVALVLVALAIVAWRWRWTGLPLAGATLIWAGGLSNLVDRFVMGRVVDFLNVGVGTLRTGIFNVADIAILAGAVMVAWGGREPS